MASLPSDREAGKMDEQREITTPSRNQTSKPAVQVGGNTNAEDTVISSLHIFSAECLHLVSFESPSSLRVHDLSHFRGISAKTHKFEAELDGAGQWGTSKRSVELAKLGLEDCRSGQVRQP